MTPVPFWFAPGSLPPCKGGRPVHLKDGTSPGPDDFGCYIDHSPTHPCRVGREVEHIAANILLERLVEEESDKHEALGFTPKGWGILVTLLGNTHGPGWGIVVALDNHSAVYIQYHANADFTGSVDVRSLSEQIARDLTDDPPGYVILDQRMNFGGDLNNTRDLMQTIPEVVGAEEHVYILVSGRTFSAGISSTGYAKQAGGDRVTIIGTPVGDDLEFWSEGDFVSLPVSGAKLLYSTERHNYMTGCQEADCHGSIRRNPIRVTSLEPDEPAAMTYGDFVAGRDPLLEKALRLIEAHRE